MIPNFNPNKWDREKIIDYVIDEQSLTDQQLAFLDYFEQLQQENKKLKEQLENVKMSYETDAEAKFYDYFEQLQQENKELTRLVANKVIESYDYDSVLKQQLNEERIERIQLRSALNENNNILKELESWLEEEQKHYLYDDARKILKESEDMFTLQDINIRQRTLEIITKKLKEFKGSLI